MTKYLVEFIGTFFLVFTIGMTVIEPGGAGVMAPVAIGMVLTAMVYAGGHVSGAHYNPAVTLAVTIRGKCSPRDAVAYVITQLAAAGAAAAIVSWFKAAGVIEPRPRPIGPVMLAEALFTFALAYVVLNVATAKATAGNSYFGVAIGMIVLAGAYAVGPVGAGAFNPAVTFGAVILGLIDVKESWIPLVGQVIGAAGAAVVFKALVKD